MLVEVGAKFYARFRQAAARRWPAAKTSHAHTAFDIRFFIERMHPNYIVIHPLSTPPSLVAISKAVTNDLPDTPVLISLPDLPHIHIGLCLEHIERKILAHTERQS
jgi:hypothetical protein